MEKINILDVLGRVSSVIGKTKNIDIAASLKVSESTCTNWKDRNTIPWVKLYEFSVERGLSFDWLLTGKEANGSTHPAVDPDIVGLSSNLAELKRAGDVATVMEVQIIVRTALRFARQRTSNSPPKGSE